MSSGQSAPPATPATESDDSSLDSSLIRGIAWTGGLKWLTQIFTWGSTIIVARLLTPEDYGLVGMATVYLGLVTVISEFGLGMAVVTLRDLSRSQIRQLNSVAILGAVVLFGISYLLAAPLSWFFNAPRLELVVIVMSGAFVLKALRIVPNALLQKELRFKLLAIIEAAQALTVAGFMVLLAWLGFSYWTLVVGSLLGAAVSTGLTIAKRPYGFSIPRLSALREPLTFSWHMLASHVSWYLYSNADFAVAGRILGQSALGAYYFAWDLARTIPAKITDVISRVAPGFFSAVQDDSEQLRRYLVRLSSGIAFLIFPATIGIALVADDFVILALGEQWTGVIRPLQLLAIYSAVRSLSPLPARVLTVTGDTRFIMRLNQLEFLILTPAFYLGGRLWGTVGIALAWLVVDPLIVSGLFRRVFRRVDLGAREYLSALWAPASSTLLMALAVLLVKYSIPADWPLAVRLAVQVLTGAAAYPLGIWTLHRGYLGDMIRLLKRVRSS